MRGVVLLGNRRLEVRDFPDPEPSDNDVLVRMKASTICGSDLHHYRASGEAYRVLYEEARRYVGSGSGEANCAGVVIAGHEPSGVVERVGRCVRNVKEGDRVSVFHIFGCGYCEMCRKGYPMYCRTPGAVRALGGNVNGAMADFLVVPWWACLALPEELSFIDGAVLGCAGLTAYQILTKLEVSARDTVAIYGLGPVGECAVLLAKALGSKIIGIDLIDERIKIAERLGLDESINASLEDPIKRIMEITHGDGVDVSLDFTGNPDASINAIRSVKPLGKVGIVGAGFKSWKPSIPTGIFPLNGIWITGARVSNINLYFDCVDFMIKHNLTFESIVTHKFPLEKAKEAFRIFDTQKTGKVGFIW